MEIFPAQIIGYRQTFSSGPQFYGFDPTTGKTLLPAFPEATPLEIQEIVALANQAFNSYRKTSPEKRCLFLEAIAENIDALGDELIQKINEETALPFARLTGERLRTTGQLKFFARLLRDGKWNQAVIDEALPDRKPIPRHEMIQLQVPLGVVAVFGASNFPLAFSVAGGDTASALAAGCPVVFKAHPAHPATCQLVGNAISKAALETGMPDGVFSMLHGKSHETGSLLVTHPLIKAVAFTGSFKGGKALFDLGVRRQEPIPVYAEMGSVNPVFFLPDAIKQGNDILATQFAQSVTLGSGQFCTNPGISIFINNEESRSFIQRVADVLDNTDVLPLLTKEIAQAYQSGLEKQKKIPGANVLTKKMTAGINPGFISCTAKQVLQQPEFFEEVFGPSNVAVLADSIDELNELATFMPGQLTASIHATEKEYELVSELMDRLTQKVGRLIMNGFPTGVEVCHAMVHGGPYPATTDSRSTSVGAKSIYRFTRPVCYQNMPVALLNL
jgi:2,5-dioxopentanoate dehydrogenase